MDWQREDNLRRATPNPGRLRAPSRHVRRDDTRRGYFELESNKSGAAMACPQIQVAERKIILLSGFEPLAVKGRPADTEVSVRERQKLEAAAQQHKDAVAFGYVRGTWMPAA